jgi:hypothetical protein
MERIASVRSLIAGFNWVGFYSVDASATNVALMPKSIKGESLHRKGADGARRAKSWLEGTSRARVSWVNPDKGAVAKLTRYWPQDGEPFSFDLFGTLQTEELNQHGVIDNDGFYAEVKNYTSASDLGTHYSEYLAKCYVMLLLKDPFADHFMWISWHPHNVKTWNELCTAGTVSNAVMRDRKRIFDPTLSDEQALAEGDSDLCEEVAKRLWLIILSEKQETLTLSEHNLGLIRADEVKRSSVR